MSVVREREKTRRTIWIVSGFVLALAIAMTTYLFARRTDMGAVSPSSVSADSDTDSVQRTAAVPAAVQPAVRESAPPPPIAATQVAIAAPAKAADLPEATPADTGSDSGDTPAPKLSAEEQSLADAVGDTRRAAPTIPAAAAAAAAPN